MLTMRTQYPALPQLLGARLRRAEQQQARRGEDARMHMHRCSASRPPACGQSRQAERLLYEHGCNDPISDASRRAGARGRRQREHLRALKLRQQPQLGADGGCAARHGATNILQQHTAKRTRRSHAQVREFGAMTIAARRPRAAARRAAGRQRSRHLSRAPRARVGSGGARGRRRQRHPRAAVLGPQLQHGVDGGTRRLE